MGILKADEDAHLLKKRDSRASWLVCLLKALVIFFQGFSFALLNRTISLKMERKGGFPMIFGLEPVQAVLLYLFLFLTGCMLGYVLEVFFRRFFTAKKWVNPGFMRGPWLPLYGFGVVIMFTVVILLLYYLPSWPFYNPFGFYDFLGEGRGPSYADLLPIAIMGCSMIALEFVAGLIFVKGFKVKLWDYSNMKGNIMGIICPQFNAIWFALAIAFYYGLNPFVYRLAQEAYAYMFGVSGVREAHFGFIFILGVAYGVMLIDFVLSAGVFTRVAKWAKKSDMKLRYDEMRIKYKEGLLSARAKFQEALPTPVKNVIENHKEKVKEGGSAPQKAASWISKLIFIDPNRAKDTTSNYDENGRPVSTEEAGKES